MLDVVDFRSSLIGCIGSTVTIPNITARHVGWWASACCSLAHRHLAVRRATARSCRLARRRAPHTTVTSITSLFLDLSLAAVSSPASIWAFADRGEGMSSIAPMTPPGQRPGFGAVARGARLAPEAALSAAVASQPGAGPAVIFLPIASATQPEGGRARGEGREGRAEGVRDVGPSWRVQLRQGESGEITTVMVDDRSGTVDRLPAPLAGDRAAQWIRWIHEGSHSGPIWQFVVFLTGVLPLVFAVTGVIMWWRGRRQRERLAASRATGPGELQAAE